MSSNNGKVLKRWKLKASVWKYPKIWYKGIIARADPSTIQTSLWLDTKGGSLNFLLHLFFHKWITQEICYTSSNAFYFLARFTCAGRQAMIQVIYHAITWHYQITISHCQGIMGAALLITQFLVRKVDLYVPERYSQTSYFRRRTSNTDLWPDVSEYSRGIISAQVSSLLRVNKQTFLIRHRWPSSGTLYFSPRAEVWLSLQGIPLDGTTWRRRRIFTTICGTMQLGSGNEGIRNQRDEVCAR